MLELKRRKKVLNFLKDLKKRVDEKGELHSNTLKNNYNLSIEELNELISNEEKTYTEDIKNKVKSLFEAILVYIGKTNMDIVAVASHKIAVSDFIEIAEKLEIEKTIIDKALKKR